MQAHTHTHTQITQNLETMTQLRKNMNLYYTVYNMWGWKWLIYFGFWGKTIISTVVIIYKNLIYRYNSSHVNKINKYYH